MTMHNLWRAKLLYDLNYGQPNFRSRDSKKVQEILTAAGRGSFAALGVELKRNNVIEQILNYFFPICQFKAQEQEYQASCCKFLPIELNNSFIFA